MSTTAATQAEKIGSAWAAMKNHAFPLDATRTVHSNLDAAVCFGFFFGAEAATTEGWQTHWEHHLAKLGGAAQFFSKEASIATRYVDMIAEQRKVEDRWSEFLRTAIVEEEEKDQVVHPDLAAQSTLLPLEYITHFARNVHRLDRKLRAKPFSDVFVPQWLKLRSTPFRLLALAQRDFQLNAIDLVLRLNSPAQEYLLAENWTITHGFQKALASALKQAWTLLEWDGYALPKNLTARPSPDSELSHFHGQTDFISPGTNEIYREMEIRYFLDKLHAPLKVHAAPLDTLGLSTDEDAHLGKLGVRGWVLDRLKDLAAGYFAKSGCPCLKDDELKLLSADEISAFVQQKGAQYDRHTGSYDAMVLRQRRDQFLFPMNLENFEKLFESGQGKDARIPFGAAQVVGTPMERCVEAINRAVRKAFGDDSKELLPFGKEAVLPLIDRALGSGTQGLSPYTFYTGTAQSVRGPLLSETPKAFLNVSADSANVLIVAWDELHSSRLLGWNQMTIGIAVSEGIYYLDAGKPGETVQPGYSLPAPCGSDCEYWNRLDWTKYVEPGKNAGSYTTDRILNVRKILERIMVGQFNTPANPSSLIKRWDPTIFARVLRSGESCILPKPQMGYMIFPLRGQPALLERNFVLDAMVPSLFLRSTLPVTWDSAYPALQPRSFSEGVFAAILEGASVDSRKLIRKWLTSKSQNSRIHSTPSFSADSWGLARGRYNEIDFGTQLDLSGLRKRFAPAPVKEWKLMHSDTKARTSGAFHDPEWFQRWRGSEFLSKNKKDMVIGNFLPAYLMETLVTISPLAHTIKTDRSQDKVAIVPIGAPISIE